MALGNTAENGRELLASVKLANQKILSLDEAYRLIAPVSAKVSPEVACCAAAAAAAATAAKLRLVHTRKDYHKYGADCILPFATSSGRGSDQCENSHETWAPDLCSKRSTSLTHLTRSSALTVTHTMQ